MNVLSDLTAGSIVQLSKHRLKLRAKVTQCHILQLPQGERDDHFQVLREEDSGEEWEFFSIRLCPCCLSVLWSVLLAVIRNSDAWQVQLPCLLNFGYDFTPPWLSALEGSFVPGVDRRLMEVRLSMG
jgi:hypothetical protein